MKYCERKKNKKEKTNKGSKVFSLLVICIFLFSLVAGAVDAAAVVGHGHLGSMLGKELGDTDTPALKA